MQAQSCTPPVVSPAYSLLIFARIWQHEGFHGVLLQEAKGCRAIHALLWIFAHRSMPNIEFEEIATYSVCLHLMIILRLIPD